MNGVNPPPLSGQTTPKTSGMAICSLVLSILGLAACLSIFTAIPGVICGHLALSRIKNSGGAMEGRGMAIAGLIIGYITIAFAIVVLPMMAAIAIPNFVKARQTSQRNACIENLRAIDGAKQQWALENRKDQGALPSVTDIEKYLGPRSFDDLKCPAGGTHSINAVGEAPTCTVERHALP